MQTTFTVSGDVAENQGHDESGPLLVTNLEAARAGTAGRFHVTHLVVPASLRQSGKPPTSFCGWPFSSGTVSISTRSDLGVGEVCEKCLPGLTLRVAARRRAIARSIARQAPERTLSERPEP